MFVRVGDQVRLEDPLRVIQSGNDASVALAEYLAAVRPPDVMNRQAALLGMKNSQFLNATGMPAEDHRFHVARDLALLARRLIEDFPDHYRYYSENLYLWAGFNTGEPITQRNRNELLWVDDSVDGIKTATRRRRAITWWRPRARWHASHFRGAGDQQLRRAHPGNAEAAALRIPLFRKQNPSSWRAVRPWPRRQCEGAPAAPWPTAFRRISGLPCPGVPTRA